MFSVLDIHLMAFWHSDSPMSSMDALSLWVIGFLYLRRSELCIFMFSLLRKAGLKTFQLSSMIRAQSFMLQKFSFFVGFCFC